MEPPAAAHPVTTDAAAGNRRCGIDTVEIARIERLLRETPAADLARLFSAQELADSGDGPGRTASLAARFAAKEACLKLFPRETALGQVEAADFSVARDDYGAPTACVQRDRRGAARALPGGAHRPFAVARSRERVRGGAWPSTTRSTCRGRAGSSTGSCRYGAA